MKYIDAEKLRAEIERLYDGEAPKHDQQCDFDDGYFTGISTISNFLDALSEEPVSDDLEEAAKQFVGYDMDRDDLRDYEIGIAAFKAGAEWQKEQMMKEAIVYVAQPDVQTGNIQVPFIRIGSTALFRYGIRVGDKVKIIIVKEDEK